jgi:hypothetical protein
LISIYLLFYQSTNCTITDYVVKAKEGIQIVVDQFIEISVDRVVDGIIHYGGRTHIVPKSTLRELIIGAMCDSPLAGHFGSSHEYEAPKVTWILSREVFRLHRLLGYIDDDRDSRFPRAVWQETNRFLVLGFHEMRAYQGLGSF